MATASLFYEKVLADELTRPFFADIKMEAQTTKLVALMASK